MPRLLEVCSGTSSVGKVIKMHGWEVMSLDIDRKARPTIFAIFATSIISRSVAHSIVYGVRPHARITASQEAMQKHRET